MRATRLAPRLCLAMLAAGAAAAADAAIYSVNFSGDMTTKIDYDCHPCYSGYYNVLQYDWNDSVYGSIYLYDSDNDGLVSEADLLGARIGADFKTRYFPGKVGDSEKIVALNDLPVPWTPGYLPDSGFRSVISISASFVGDYLSSFELNSWSFLDLTISGATGSYRHGGRQYYLIRNIAYSVQVTTNVLDPDDVMPTLYPKNAQGVPQAPVPASALLLGSAVLLLAGAARRARAASQRPIFAKARS